MKAIMYPAISLDGFIAKPDGDSYSWVNLEDEARYDSAVKECGCVLVGRKTYEEYIEDFRAKQDMKIFVVTNQSNYKDEDLVKYVRGSASEILDVVESSGFSKIIVCGGGEVNGLLAAAGLVDEIIISVQPVVLGQGIPLFGSYKPNIELELISSNQDVKGIIQNHYVVNSLDN